MCFYRISIYLYTSIISTGFLLLQMILAVYHREFYLTALMEFPSQVSLFSFYFILVFTLKSTTFVQHFFLPKIIPLSVTKVSRKLRSSNFKIL